MDELMKKAARSALFFISACLIVWAIWPEGRAVAAGLILGTTASVINVLMLRRRIIQIGRIVEHKGPTRVGLGLAGRLATVLLAAMTAYRYPEYFHPIATLAACFYAQLVVFVSSFLHHSRNYNGKG